MMLRASLAQRCPRRVLFSTSSRLWNAQKPGNDGAIPLSSPPPPLPAATAAGQPESDTPHSALPGDLPSSSSSHTNPTPHKEASKFAVHDVKQRVHEWSNDATVSFRSKADAWTDSTKVVFSKLGAELNKVTGYEAIETMKRQVGEQEKEINDLRRAAKDAKVNYELAVVQRSKSQREVNDLLQRKAFWTESDLSRFTTLVREDHMFEQEEARAKNAMDSSEATVEAAFSRLMRTILDRYHEEQVWSDKIRSASTYGQLAALGLNMIVFLLAIVMVEPWKRKRLAQTFENKVDELSRETQEGIDTKMEQIRAELAIQAAVLHRLALPNSHEEQPILYPTTTTKQESIHIGGREIETRLLYVGLSVTSSIICLASAWLSR